MAKGKTSASSIYRIKIILLGLKPQIWRIIEVRGNTRLDHLNLMIQAAMGWTNSHLHSFQIGDDRYGMRHDEFDEDLRDERRYRLDELVTREKDRFVFEYDFGDGWEHGLEVKKIAPAEAGVKYPRCIGGARSCPPEDCGGIYGYMEFVKAIRNPKHEEHESMLEWVGGEFDPDAFDLKEANVAVRDFKSMEAELM